MKFRAAIYLRNQPKGQLRDPFFREIEGRGAFRIINEVRGDLLDRNDGRGQDEPEWVFGWLQPLRPK